MPDARISRPSVAKRRLEVQQLRMLEEIEKAEDDGDDLNDLPHAPGRRQKPDQIEEAQEYSDGDQ
jgi:hypothetical protein